VEGIIFIIATIVINNFVVAKITPKASFLLQAKDLLVSNRLLLSLPLLL